MDEGSGEEGERQKLVTLKDPFTQINTHTS